MCGEQISYVARRCSLPSTGGSILLPKILRWLRGTRGGWLQRLQANKTSWLCSVNSWEHSNACRSKARPCLHTGRGNARSPETLLAGPNNSVVQGGNKQSERANRKLGRALALLYPWQHPTVETHWLGRGVTRCVMASPVGSYWVMA